MRETEKIAQEFLKKILGPSGARRGPNATVVGLYGELGAGKTVFAQAVARSLGIKRKVASPTFVIMKRYEIPAKYLPKNLFHIDAYRLKNEKDILHLGWQEIIDGPDNLVLVEWPERVRKVMPEHHQVKISHTRPRERRFEILHRNYPLARI